DGSEDTSASGGSTGGDSSADVDGGGTETPDVLDAAPDALADATPDALPDATSDALADATHDAFADAPPDAVADAAPDALADDGSPEDAAEIIDGSADVADAGGPDGNTPDADAGCVGQTNEELCALLGAECDRITKRDRCGRKRTPVCGHCDTGMLC